jgi:hypothetical protein
LAHRANDGYEWPATRIDELRDQIVWLERGARQSARREAEAQAATWFTHARVETLLEIIQLAFPDAVAFLRQQIAAYLPVREHPDPDTYDNFQAKKHAAAKQKTEGDNSDDDREEGTSRKRRWMQRKVVEDEMVLYPEPRRGRSPVKDRNRTRPGTGR